MGQMAEALKAPMRSPSEGSNHSITAYGLTFPNLTVSVFILICLSALAFDDFKDWGLIE